MNLMSRFYNYCTGLKHMGNAMLVLQDVMCQLPDVADFLIIFIKFVETFNDSISSHTGTTQPSRTIWTSHIHISFIGVK